MKSLPQKHPTVRRDNTAWEISQIQALNADRNRLYPEIDRDLKAARVSIMRHTLSVWPNSFALCRAAAKVTRMIHDPNSKRVPHAINQALTMLSRPAKRKPRAISTMKTPVPPMDLFLIHGEAV